MHLASAGATGLPAVAFIAFDLLRDGATDLRGRPLIERREALERVFVRTGRRPILRISEIVRGDGRDAARARARERLGRPDREARRCRVYHSGKRTPDWRKLKIVHEQEFVIGGWTEPRQTRMHLGALLLGVYEGSDARVRRPRRHRLRRTASWRG